MTAFTTAKEWVKSHKRLHRPLKNTAIFWHALGESNPLVYNCRNWTSSKFIRALLKLIVSPYYILDYFRYKDIPGRKGLAMVVIVKNEAPYIAEWINFHHKQGVSHFIIYNNESTDNLYEVLKPYIDYGLVTYHTIGGRGRQEDTNNAAIHEYGHKFKYMAFIDVDEFMFMRVKAGKSGNICEFLDDFMREHPNAGGIAVNWRMFGSSGYVTKPEGGVLENYTHCAEEDYYRNYTFKSICDTAKIWAFSKVNNHAPVYRHNFHVLNENGEDTCYLIANSVTTKIAFDKIRINHYFIKSKEEFLAKRARGRNSPNILPLSEFDEQDRNEVYDTEILSRV